MFSERYEHIAQVFETIKSEWIAHLADIDVFVLRIEEQKRSSDQKTTRRQNWSFEEDLNRWAREGCRKREGWESRENCRNVYADGSIPDAVVTVPGRDPVLVETKAVNNVTGSKWIGSINQDTHKLATKSPYPGLQILACFDTFDLETADDWTSWLARIQIWNKETSMVFRQPLCVDGKMLVKGWAISPDCG
jgi:hypothetical protein